MDCMSALQDDFYLGDLSQMQAVCMHCDSRKYQFLRQGETGVMDMEGDKTEHSS